MIIARVCIILIKTVRPLLGPSGCCIYQWSCYDFGIAMLEQEPLLKAFMLITKRVLSCHPFSKEHS